MSRQGRTVVVIGIIAVAGIGLLALLANRYGGLLSKGETAAALEKDAGGGTGEGLDRELDVFLAARREIRRNLEAEYGPIEPRRERGKVRHANAVQDQAMFRALVGIRLARDEKLAAAGIPAERYAAIRQAYRLWMDGKKAQDAVLEAAFDRRADEMLTADLAGYEPFDY